MRTRFDRPYRNKGIAYVPKRRKVELDIQLKFCAYVRKDNPALIFHSDYAAGLDLTANQATTNKGLQSRHQFPDWTCYAPSPRISPITGRPYIGLAIEIKKDGTTVILKIGQDKGQLTKDEHIRGQAKTLHELNQQGWYANFGIGYDQCVQIYKWYFGQENLGPF